MAVSNVLRKCDTWITLGGRASMLLDWPLDTRRRGIRLVQFGSSLEREQRRIGGPHFGMDSLPRCFIKHYARMVCGR
jgi:hypothetical protein